MNDPKEMNDMETSDTVLPAFVSGSKRLLIGGQWRPAASGKEFDTINPATGKVIARSREGDAADIDLAVKAARRAFEGEWSRWTPYDRAEPAAAYPRSGREALDELALIETLDMGAPLARTKALKNWVSQVILFFASQTAPVAPRRHEILCPGRS